MFSAILFPILAILSLVSARSGLIKRDLTPGVATSSSIIYPGDHGYTYKGCYNETTGLSNSGGVRALSNGNMTSGASMTPQSCITTCRQNSMQYAGLEYGQECWCSPYLSTLSAKLNESMCDLTCVGNTSEVCGGRLTFSLYQLTPGYSAATSVNNGIGGWIYVAGLGLVGSLASML